MATTTCYVKPNRSRKRHFTAKDAGRCVAYARRDGANDAVLLGYLLQAYGVRSLSCAMLRVLDILNTGFFLTAVVGLFKGVALVMKGIRLIQFGKGKLVTTLLELILPKKWMAHLGVFFIWVGSVEAVCSAAVIFVTAIANNVALYQLMKGTCEAALDPYPIEPQTLELQDFGEAIRLLDDALRQNLKQPPPFNE